MTTINTDYSNTELLDQELTTAELSEVSGGISLVLVLRRLINGPE